MLKGREQKQKKRSLWLVLFALWLVAALMFYLRRDRPIALHARSFVEACFEGDVSSQMRYAFPEELEANAMTKQKLSDLNNLILRKRFKGFHILGHPTCDTLADGSQGGGYAVLEGPNGYRYEFARSLWSADDGPKGLVITMILDAWLVDKLVRNGKTLTAKNKTQAYMEGYAEDGPILKQLGIEKVPYLNIQAGTVGFSDWSQMMERWQKRLKNFEQNGDGAVARL